MYALFYDRGGTSESSGKIWKEFEKIRNLKIKKKIRKFSEKSQKNIIPEIWKKFEKKSFYWNFSFFAWKYQVLQKEL